MKITIIGPSGGGKSTLARRISEKFTIPHLQIDRLWFEAGGHTTLGIATEEEKEIIGNYISDAIKKFLKENEHWVCDGTYTALQPLIVTHADRLVLINRPLPQRIFSGIMRVLKNEHRHPETTKLGDLFFIRHMVRRTRNGETQKLKSFCAPYQEKYIELRSFKEIDDYFESL